MSRVRSERHGLSLSRSSESLPRVVWNVAGPNPVVLRNVFNEHNEPYLLRSLLASTRPGPQREIDHLRTPRETGGSFLVHHLRTVSDVSPANCQCSQKRVVDNPGVHKGLSLSGLESGIPRRGTRFPKGDEGRQRGMTHNSVSLRLPSGLASPFGADSRLLD